MLQTVMLGMIARTLMKDAHGDLIRHSGMQSHAISQIYPVLAQPASHHRWQCKVISICS
ncbi:hypothetical protein B0G75_12480 [Paraburkholderia sp. BL18I3N2]|nr:hypothetical protein B0G75_12480 [Paraburkholderia sp. BL18I3N2]PRX87527.1 hypothetical protein B0G73_15219 [Paraburkholderia sp. BL25I1N1]